MCIRLNLACSVTSPPVIAIMSATFKSDTSCFTLEILFGVLNMFPYFCVSACIYLSISLIISLIYIYYFLVWVCVCAHVCVCTCVCMCAFGSVCQFLYPCLAMCARVHASTRAGTSIMQIHKRALMDASARAPAGLASCTGFTTLSHP